MGSELVKRVYKSGKYLEILILHVWSLGFIFVWLVFIDLRTANGLLEFTLSLVWDVGILRKGDTSSFQIPELLEVKTL